MNPRALLPALLLASCAWDAPLAQSPDSVSNVISGTVVVNAETVTGTVLVLLYAADDPPPPDGTGRPVTLASLDASRFSGSAGVQSAPFAITEVPDGDWLVVALLDNDHDFHPLVEATGGATCGDMLGSYLADLSTGEIGVVSTEGGELVDGVTVLVGSEVPLERPAFTFKQNTVSRSDEAPVLTISATDVNAISEDLDGNPWTVLDLTGPLDIDAVLAGTAAYDPCDVAFNLWIPDDDGAFDGNPHPNPAYAELGLIEIWPRFYLQYLGDDLEEGESYVSEAVWATPVLSPLAFQSAFLSGALAFDTIIPQSSLDLYFPPVAVHRLPDGTEATVQGADVPAGAWSLTVVSITGQTWTLPNDLSAFPSGSSTYVPSQQALTVNLQ